MVKVSNGSGAMIAGGIIGRPTTVGSYTVTVTATDTLGYKASTTVVRGEPQHLVDLQQDVDLGVGQLLDLGFSDVAAHPDGVHLHLHLHLQLDSAPGQDLGQSRTRRPCAGPNLLGFFVHPLPVSWILGRARGDAPPAGQEFIQRGQVDDGRMGDRFELGVERGDVGGRQGRAYGGERPLDLRTGAVVSLNGHNDASPPADHQLQPQLTEQAGQKHETP
jgi:hypothetical protein